MNCSPHTPRQKELLQQLLEFVATCQGLATRHLNESEVQMTQLIDGKSVCITASNLEALLMRTDSDGLPFVQINYQSGLKLLVTSGLVGFKPSESPGLDLNRIPRVVTTPDLASIFEAIQDAMHAIDSSADEVRTLRQVFEAVVSGGEAAGFNLATERSWLRRIPIHLQRTSA